MSVQRWEGSGDRGGQPGWRLHPDPTREPGGAVRGDPAGGHQYRLDQRGISHPIWPVQPVAPADWGTVDLTVPPN
jgi:hypothetical protein